MHTFFYISMGYFGEKNNCNPVSLINFFCEFDIYAAGAKMVIQQSQVAQMPYIGDNPLPQEQLGWKQTNETSPLLALVMAAAVAVALGGERCLWEGKTRPDHNVLLRYIFNGGDDYHHHSQNLNDEGDEGNFSNYRNPIINPFKNRGDSRVDRMLNLNNKTYVIINWYCDWKSCGIYMTQIIVSNFFFVVRVW